MKKTTKNITAEEFDRKVDSGESLEEFVDWSEATKQISLDLPIWALKKIDAEATRRGVSRQPLLKMWIIDKLDGIQAPVVASPSVGEKKRVG